MELNEVIVENLMKQGVKFINSKNYVKAAERFSSAVKLKPENGEVLMFYGISLFHKGNIEEAIAIFRKSIQLDPALSMAWFQLGKALRKKNDLEGALKAYDAFIAFNSKDIYGGYLKKAEVLFVMGKPEEALIQIDKAIENKDCDCIGCKQLATKLKIDILEAIEKKKK